MNRKLIPMKTLKLTLFILLTFVIGYHQAKACHGMPLLNYNVTVGTTGITINANSDPSTCGCGPYWLQTEISCTQNFVGTQPACLTSTLTNWNNPATSYLNYPYYNALLNVPNYNIGTGWFDNCVLEPYHPNVIPFSNLCPGKTYYIRSREMVMAGNPGPWSPVQSFVVPGSPIVNPPNTLNMTLSASPNQIICCGPVQLTAIITGTNYGQCVGNVPSCEQNVTVTPTFSWTSSNNVSTTVGNGNTFTTSINLLSVTNITATTTFSVWLTYLCSSPSGTIMYTPPSIPIIFTNLPLSSSNITNTFVTAASNAAWTQALSACLNGSPCMCQFLSAQPAVVTVNVLSVPPPLTVTMTPNTCLSSPNFTFTDTSPNSSNFNLNWNFGDGGTGTGTTVVHTYTAAGIYTVTVNKAGCGPCMAFGSYTVQVYPAPNATLSVNSPVCIGGTASFTNTFNNGVSYSWTGPNNYTSTAQNPVINNVTTTMAGIYTCVTTDANGCTGTSTVSLATYQATMSAAANSPVCPGSTLNLTASGNGNYSWTGPNNFTSTQHNSSFIAANNSGGTYLVTATLTGNCYASASVTVAISTTSVSANNNGPVCSGNNVQLHAFGNGTFVWYGPNGYTSNLQNPVINNATANASGVYTVVITSAQGCTATATTNVLVNSQKVLNPSCSPAELCEGGVINFEALDGSGVSYLWKGPNGFVSTNANMGILDATLLNSGTYTLTMVDPAGCTAVGNVNVLVNAKPVIDIDMSKAISACAPVSNVEFEAIANSGIELEWQLGNGQLDQTTNPKNLVYNTAGIFTITLTGTNAKGCKAEIQKTFETYPTPIANFDIGNNGSTWVNGTTQFTDLSSRAKIVNWDWTFGNPDVTSTIQNPSFTYQDSGRYNVTLVVTSDKGCKSSISKTVIVGDEMGLFLPNAFTPNGDGSNDVFLAIANNITKFEMLIFNRGGSLVFQSSDIKKGWDGTYKGQLSENNVYVYKVNYIGKDSKSHVLTGSITLIR